ncbi:MAG: hypothetical protein KAX55_01530 [Propionivibrio sp.]|nr:hypothetical protein [Propionivibrio sp.]
MTVQRRRRPPSGCSLKEQIIDTDGTLYGVGFYSASASGRRPNVIGISIARRTQKAFATVMSVDGKDFRTVYNDIVVRLADYYGVLDDPELVKSMLATCDQFLKKNGLVLDPVVIRYEQVRYATQGQ